MLEGQRSAPLNAKVDPKPVILHVEDNEARGYAIAHTLRRANFSVVTANSGEEGLRVAARENPDLIVLDVNLPDISGFEVCRRLRVDPATSRIPVLYLSATEIRVCDKTRGLDVGADAYLAEPVESGEFLATINALLRVRRSEAQARALANRWETTFAAISDPIFVTSNDEVITECNERAAELFAISRERLLGQKLSDRLHDCFSGAIPLAIQSTDWADAQGLECRLAGRWFRITASDILDGDRVDGRVWVFSDITAIQEASHRSQEAEQEQRRLADKLARSNRDLEDFASAVSHDLQEPLRTISTFVGLLDRKFGEDDRTRSFMGYVRQGTQRMHAMIQDLLQFSRFSTAPSEMETVESEVLVRDALDNLQVAIEESGAEIEVGPLPKVCGDRGQLSRLFQNLLGNAIKFRRELSPQVQVFARTENGFHTFTIADNGIGFEMGSVDAIFQIFRRLHSQEAYPGTGVGLAVCKRIVEGHQGRIWAESTPNVGSRFYFRLPIDQKPVSPTPGMEAKRS